MLCHRRFWLAVLFCLAASCGGQDSDSNSPPDDPGNPGTPGGPGDPNVPFPPSVADEPFCGFGDWRNNHERLLREDLREGFGPNAVTDIFENFGPRAEFDNWWVNVFLSKKPYPDGVILYNSNGSMTITAMNDLDSSLALVGLRTKDDKANGLNNSERQINRVSRALVLRLMFGWLTAHFGNHFDGSPAFDGLAITFYRPSGPSWNEMWQYGAETSTISVRYGTNASVIGASWLDPSNAIAECNVNEEMGIGNGRVDFGVFVNRLLGRYQSIFQSTYGARADQSWSVTDADFLTLKKMLVAIHRYDTDPKLLLDLVQNDSHARWIFIVADSLARTLATVAAHQIGHSVGLDHLTDTTLDSTNMMNKYFTLHLPNYSVNAFDRNAFKAAFESPLYFFSAADWNILRANLPGSGKRDRRDDERPDFCQRSFAP